MPRFREIAAWVVVAVLNLGPLVAIFVRCGQMDEHQIRVVFLLYPLVALGMMKAGGDLFGWIVGTGEQGKRAMSSGVGRGQFPETIVK